MEYQTKRARAATPDDAVDALRQLMASRFTCRGYLPDAVPDETIASIIDIARGTPSWCNTQPWHVVVTRGEATEAFRAALVERATQAPQVESDLPFPVQYSGVHAERRRETGHALYEALGIERHDKVRRDSQSFENFRFFGAPHVAIITIPAELGTYAAVDCGGFIASFLLAAHAHGVATAPQGALARHARFIRSYFGLGEDRHMVCGIAFGYADHDHPANSFRTRRAELDDVLKFV
ncbi:nitroreductase [Ralstonia insidiosa]|uniref:nitroreductase n=1 Tax=Ralstonia TaxID=48736 RepID=UPI00066CA2C1|nr:MULTISPECIES: nitroreductase [Ralstonia]MBY4708119.1 nitroreductase [Ralstonia insidiosa]